MSYEYLTRCYQTGPLSSYHGCRPADSGYATTQWLKQPTCLTSVRVSTTTFQKYDAFAGDPFTDVQWLQS